MKWTAIAYRSAVIALLASIWWMAGGGDWAQRTYWAAYFSRPGAQTEQPKAGGFDPLEAGSEQTLQDMADRARAESASTPRR